MTKNRGFTLVELLIVIGIIGVLAAVAIPAYKQYLARAQMSESMDLLASAKVPMAEFYNSRGQWPPSPGSVLGLTSGRYVSSIAMSAPNSTSVALTLTATMKSAGSSIASDLAGKTVMLQTTDAGKTWSCVAGTVAPQFLPGTCR